MDLAARNVLLAEDSVIKIADFGLTHSFDEGKDYYKQLGVLKLSIRWLAIDSFDNKVNSFKLHCTALFLKHHPSISDIFGKERCLVVRCDHVGSIQLWPAAI